MPTAPTPPFTAFAASERDLARQIRNAKVDFDAFLIPLKACQLSHCKATCCHDGVFLESDEVEILDHVLQQKTATIHALGWHVPEPFTPIPPRWRSICLPAPPNQVTDDFPSHFPKTRCIFLNESHHCLWQSLAIQEKQHPWFWKPISCWMHPLILLPPSSTHPHGLLTLAQASTDPAKKPGYPGFASCTPCGQAQFDSPPAWQSLHQELEFLSQISSRPLIQEFQLHFTSHPDSAGKDSSPD